MRLLILSGTPKHGGLCDSLVDAAREAASEYGAVEVVELACSGIGACRCCGDGWGSCGSAHVCDFGADGFAALQQKCREADAFVFVSPVYWGEVSEPTKALLDRLRRCEAREEGALADKRALLVASAGGTGNGVSVCLAQLERFCQHTRCRVFDMVGVTRRNAAYKGEAVRAAVAAMRDWE